MSVAENPNVGQVHGGRVPTKIVDRRGPGLLIARVAMIAYHRELRYGLHHIGIATTTGLKSFDPDESLNFRCVGRRGCCLHVFCRDRWPTEKDAGPNLVY